MTLPAFNIENNRNHNKVIKYAKKADEMYLNNDFTGAKFYIDKINKIINKPNIILLDLEARTEFNLGHTKKAISLIDKAISITPSDILYENKGIFYKNVKNYQEAIKQFKNSLALCSHNNPSNLHIAEIHLRCLDFNIAYLLLTKERNNLPSYRAHWEFLFNQCLENLSDLQGIPLMDLYSNLINYLNNDNSSLNYIGKLCHKVILLMQNEHNISSANNQLLLTCLENGIISNCELEISLRKDRKLLLQTHLSHLDINNDNLPLASALAINAFYNEYIVYFDQDEKELLRKLKNIIKGLVNDKVPIANISGFILLYIMYEPINSLELNSYIENNTQNEWPDTLKNIIQWSIRNPLIEDKIKENLAQLNVPKSGDQTTSVSSVVQQQYEENPYPRWIKLQVSATSQKYIQSSEPLQLNLKNTGILESENLQILVAGCGTGEHPLYLAKTVENANILAIDISKASLAYAHRMANEYDINNIQFMQADILNLSQVNKKFHIIETLGVLHHMKNPEAGLQTLRKLIITDGIIMIGLYSSTARKTISQLRQQNLPISKSPNKEDIRNFRYSIMTKPGSEYHTFTTFRDFYSASGCRDLLFHEHEYTYSIPRLNVLLTNNRLRFLGFQQSHQTLEHYKSLYPDDPTTLNLEHWHDYEQQYPDTFKGMYVFHCQAIE